MLDWVGIDPINLQICRSGLIYLFVLKFWVKVMFGDISYCRRTEWIPSKQSPL